MKTLLHLQDLEKSFGRQMVLDHVGFDLQPGEIIGLIGPSGAGKSTMIKTMLGMAKADSGIALVLNHTMPNRHILGDIGYMAQSDALYEALSGQENLEFFGQLKGLSKKDLKDEIAHVAQVVDLTDHLNKAMMFPPNKRPTLSVSSASSMTWVVTRIPTPLSLSMINSSQIFFRREGSIPTVGSSKIKSCGFPKSAMASDKRRFIPPE